MQAVHSVYIWKEKESERRLCACDKDIQRTPNSHGTERKHEEEEKKKQQINCTQNRETYTANAYEEYKEAGERKKTDTHTHNATQQTNQTTKF